MKRTHLKSWDESRRELLARVKAAFAEAESEFEARKVAKEERERQVELCRKLCEKVSCRIEILSALHGIAQGVCVCVWGGGGGGGVVAGAQLHCTIARPSRIKMIV